MKISNVFCILGPQVFSNQTPIDCQFTQKSPFFFLILLLKPIQIKILFGGDKAVDIVESKYESGE